MAEPMRPRLLDLFSCAGGAARGYQLAGFHVTGVDIRPQPRYAGDVFVQADALTFPLDGFDAIHASPPCQAYSDATPVTHKHLHPRLIGDVQARLRESGLPYVIENVTGARAHLDRPLLLCGSMFGLGATVRGEWRQLLRHRWFETTTWTLSPFACAHTGKHITVRVGSNARRGQGGVRDLSAERVAMGIDWMTGGELTEAIPPAYTEWLGRRLLEAIRRAA